MTLEVGEHHGEVIVQVVRAHEVLLQVLAARDRQSRLAVRIHDVHGSDGRESVVLGSLATGFRGAALAGVGRVALHDGAVHFLYQVLDEGGLQEVVSARFARGDFDGHLARGFAAQGLVNLHQVLGADFLEHVHFGQGFFGGCRGLCRLFFRRIAACRAGHGCQCEQGARTGAEITIQFHNSYS